MLAGLGRMRRVLLGDTLLDGFTPDEIEVIFAHEVGHHVFRHIRKMIFGGHHLQRRRFLDMRPPVGRSGPSVGGSLDYATLPVWLLPWLLLILTLFASLLEPLQNRRESSLRAAMRPLCLAADGAAGGLYFRVSQVGPTQQRRSRPALAGGFSCFTVIRRSPSGWRWPRKSAADRGEVWRDSTVAKIVRNCR